MNGNGPPRTITLTAHQIDAFLRAAEFAVDAGYQDIEELNDVVTDLRQRGPNRVLPFATLEVVK